MNNEEAKFILQGYRPNGSDAADAAFGAALEQARKDPALADWFARQQAFDTAVSAKLGSIAPPAGLRDAILAGGGVSASRSTRPAWTRPAWMGVAAAIAITLGATVALWPTQASAFSRFTLADARQSATHGGHGHETNELQAVLNSPAMRLGQRLPINFPELLRTGCRTATFQGKPVLEVCFNRNGVWFHCYIAQASDFPRLAMTATPKLTDRDGVATASWTDREHLIVVVSKTGRANLEGLL